MTYSNRGTTDSRMRSTYIPGSYWYTYGTAAIDLGIKSHKGALAGEQPYLYMVDDTMDPSQSPLATPRTKYESSKRRRSFYQSVIDIAIFTLIFLIALYISAIELSDPTKFAYTGEDRVVQTEVISVLEGDTLWSISERNPIEGMDTRERVEWIVRHNSLTSSDLVVGQTLEIPVTA